MIFSELYSTYYQTVAKIITMALAGRPSLEDLSRCIQETAFSESVLTILPALTEGRWPLLNEDLTSSLCHPPTLPLTLLEKRWLKAIMADPRIQLFDVTFPDLEGIDPLFTQEDYRVFDRYTDGDPFNSHRYIHHFRLLLAAIKGSHPVQITMTNRYGRQIQIHFYPTGFEYSLKDDKIRVLAKGCRYPYFNLARIDHCKLYQGSDWQTDTPLTDRQKELTLLIENERNTLERVMLHFAHFSKQAERLADGSTRLQISYYASDEKELLIRVLAFGPYVKVEAPDDFVNLIKDRLLAQKSCEL
ncbi:MAG: WYL domain-containing protein [Clostridiales bacterium]|nr:WYL domain-containing protein [Clostridiales bacterium]